MYQSATATSTAVDPLTIIHNFQRTSFELPSDFPSNFKVLFHSSILYASYTA